ncbi:hypothetical protein K9U34_01920 [Lawsonia intracellularis]|uniref:Uncharacterized protein n=1 Tax=Lawsonia intracellularis (strain PHE/MN1-00) TaxID=363253 RepID=Q1MRW9_LAWIP|nr:hypothetical protein [Lawsonia intracellularis]AGC49605.1 hypothetical protein LAW_00204 [Lawsonia intracellularis N343]KAA0205112.1 hypothetical protein C4K43_01230 [Lawsonia intracellularis]MBZ3892362.1 hypothetical protein [Lawsonia intracellularis]OMQ05941.1 hypothetical protein BW722_01065 [Lawsonia intracellularis]RBN32341.1 hypothetical protein DR194_05145 [Lawsonia intracellularis]
MEQLLIKLARQLESLDEASLMALWEKYANIVSQFEPTKRWEEATLIFSLIQAKHMKNQLFNYNWAEQVRPSTSSHEVPISVMLETKNKPHEVKQAKIIPFKKLIEKS